MLRAWSLLQWLLKYQNFLSYTADENAFESAGPQKTDKEDYSQQSLPTDESAPHRKLYTNVIINISSYELHIPKLELILQDYELSLKAVSPIIFTMRSPDQTERLRRDNKSPPSYLRTWTQELKSLILFIFISGIASFVQWFVNYKRNQLIEETKYRLQIEAPDVTVRATHGDVPEDQISMKNLPMLEIFWINFAHLAIVLSKDSTGYAPTNTLVSIRKFGSVRIPDFKKLSIEANLLTQSLEIRNTDLVRLLVELEEEKKQQPQPSFFFSLISCPTGASTMMDEVAPAVGDGDDHDVGAKVDDDSDTGDNEEVDSDDSSSMILRYLDLIVAAIFGEISSNRSKDITRNSCCSRENLFIGFRSFRVRSEFAIFYGKNIKARFKKLDLGVSRNQASCILEQFLCQIPDHIMSLTNLFFTHQGEDRLFILEGLYYRDPTLHEKSSDFNIPQLTVHLVKDSGNLALSGDSQFSVELLWKLMAPTTNQIHRTDSNSRPSRATPFIEEAKQYLLAALWTISLSKADLSIFSWEFLFPDPDEQSLLPTPLWLCIRDATMMIQPDSLDIICFGTELLGLRANNYLELTVRKASFIKLSGKDFDFFEDTFLSIRAQGACQLLMDHRIIEQTILLDGFEGCEEEPGLPSTLRIYLENLALISRDWHNDSIIIGSALKIASGNIDFGVGESDDQNNFSNHEQMATNILTFQNLEREPYSKIVTMDRTSICLDFPIIQCYLSDLNKIIDWIKLPVFIPWNSGIFKTEANDQVNVTDDLPAGEDRPNRDPPPPAAEDHAGDVERKEEEAVMLDDDESVQVRRSAVLQFLKMYEREETLRLLPSTSSAEIKPPRRLESIYADLWFRLQAEEGLISLIPTSQKSSIKRVLEFFWTSPSWIDFDLSGTITYLEMNPHLRILKEIRKQPHGSIKFPSTFLVKEIDDEIDIHLERLTASLPRLGAIQHPVTNMDPEFTDPLSTTPHPISDIEMQSFIITETEASIRLGFTQSVTVIQTVQPLNLNLRLANEDLGLISLVCESVMSCLGLYTQIMSHCIDQSGSFTLRLDLALKIDFIDSIKIDTTDPIQFIYRDTSVLKNRILNSDSRIGLYQPGDLKIYLNDGSKASIMIQGYEINISLLNQSPIPLNATTPSDKQETGKGTQGPNSRGNGRGGEAKREEPVCDDFNQLSIFAKNAMMNCTDEKSIAEFYHQYNDLLSFWYTPNQAASSHPTHPQRMTIDMPVRRFDGQKLKKLPWEKTYRLWQADPHHTSFIKIRELDLLKENKKISEHITLWNRTGHTFTNTSNSCQIQPNESLILPESGEVIFRADSKIPTKARDLMSFKIQTPLPPHSYQLNSPRFGSDDDDDPHECQRVKLDYQLYQNTETKLIYRAFIIRALEPSTGCLLQPTAAADLLPSSLPINQPGGCVSQLPSSMFPRRSSRATVADDILGNDDDTDSLMNDEFRRCRSDQGPVLSETRTILHLEDLVESGIVSIQTLTSSGLLTTCSIISEDQTFEVEGDVRKLFLTIPKANSYSPFSTLPLDETIQVDIPAHKPSTKPSTSAAAATAAGADSPSSFMNQAASTLQPAPAELHKLPWPPETIVLTYGNGLDITIYLKDCSSQGRKKISIHPGTVIRSTRIDDGPLRICYEGGKSHQNLGADSKICLFRPLRYCVIKNSENAAADITEYTAPLTDASGMVIFSSCVFPFGDDNESTPMFVMERLITWSRDPHHPHEMILTERPLYHPPILTHETMSVVYNNSSIPLCLLSGLGGKYIAPYHGWCYMNLKDTFLLASVKPRPPYRPTFICVGSLPGSTTESGVYATPSYTIAPKQSPQFQPFVSYSEVYNLFNPAVPTNLAPLFSSKLSSPVTAESIKKTLILSQQKINIQLIYRNPTSIHMIISSHVKAIEKDQQQQQQPRRMRCRLHTGDLKLTLKDIKFILRKPNILISPASDGNSITMQWCADSGLYWKEKPLLCLPVSPSNSKNSFSSDDNNIPWGEHPPGQCNLTFVFQSTIHPSKVSETVLKGITIGLEDSVMRAVIDPAEFAEFTSFCKRIANECRDPSVSDEPESQILIENLVVTETTVEALADKFISLRTFTTLPQYEFTGCAQLIDAISSVWNSHVLQHIKQSWPSILLNTRVGSTSKPAAPNRSTNVP